VNGDFVFFRPEFDSPHKMREKAGSVISTEGPFPNSTSDILILPEIPMALENKQKDGAKRD